MQPNAEENVRGRKPKQVVPPPLLNSVADFFETSRTLKKSINSIRKVTDSSETKDSFSTTSSFNLTEMPTDVLSSTKIQAPPCVLDKTTEPIVSFSANTCNTDEDSRQTVVLAESQRRITRRSSLLMSAPNEIATAQVTPKKAPSKANQRRTMFTPRLFDTVEEMDISTKDNKTTTLPTVAPTKPSQTMYTSNSLDETCNFTKTPIFIRPKNSVPKTNEELTPIITPLMTKQRRKTTYTPHAVDLTSVAETPVFALQAIREQSPMKSFVDQSPAIVKTTFNRRRTLFTPNKLLEVNKTHELEERTQLIDMGTVSTSQGPEIQGKS